MKAPRLPLVLFSGMFFFAIGVAVGFHLGRFKAGDSGELQSLRQDETERGRAFSFPWGDRRPQERQMRRNREDDSPDKRERHNPFLGSSPADLVAVLNQPPREGDGDRRHLAREALSELAKKDPLSIAPLLSSISRHGPMHQLCRELVLHGGQEGMMAVLDFISDKNGDIEMRSEAIHALGSLPPEARETGMAGLLELTRQSFPQELQHSVCNALGEISGEAGVENLLGLLKNEDCKLRPQVVLETVGRMGTPAHARQLLSLLEEGSWTHDMQASILRSAARAGKSGDFLLDSLLSKEDGPSPRVLARALADAAPWIDLDPERVVAALQGDLPSGVRGELARALIRSGGEGELDYLLDVARDPSSGIDADSLGAALAEAGHEKLLPTMVDILDEVKNPDTQHHLARSIVEHGGREGVEALLGLLEEGNISGDRLHPLCEPLAEAGAPEDAERLFRLLEGTNHREDARALLKAAVSLSGNDGLDRCLGLLREAEEGVVRAAAADIVGHLDAAGHVPELVEALAREEFGSSQWHLARALVGAGEEGTSRLAEFLSRDRNTHRKHEILSSLADQEEYDATPIFIRTLLSDGDPHVRERAAEILSKTADDRAVTALTQALRQESDSQFRRHVAKLLSQARERRGDGE